MRNLVSMLGLAALASIALLAPSTASARSCVLNLGSAAVKSNVSCHITNVVVEKAIPRIAAGRENFRVYARGYWHCSSGEVEGYHALICNRHGGVISIVTE
jgi:hypothetical protein